MTARILVVDDLAPNRHLMQVKLAAEYYDVVTTGDGADAIEIAKRERIDLILMDAVMPVMDGFECCRRLKKIPETYHIPVIMVTALEEAKDRIRGLEAGADDFITKPIDDFNLMARVRSMLRLKMVTDQLLVHTGQSPENSRPILEQLKQRRGRILIVEDQEKRAAQMRDFMADLHDLHVITDAQDVMSFDKSQIDLIIISLTSPNFDGLRICASLRFDQSSRDIPMLAIGSGDDENQFVRAYDLGINDTLARPIEKQELRARVHTQLRRKFFADALRENFNQNLEMVIADPLTSLGNRRFFERSVRPLFAENAEKGTPLSIAIMDIDNFKRVNDILGHDMGDEVLKEVAARLVTNMRAVDIVSRYGGEEFMIAMPDTDENEARHAMDRVRAMLYGTPVFVDNNALNITISGGVAQVEPGETLRDVIKRADTALYQAKKLGRNRVLASGTKKAA